MKKGFTLIELLAVIVILSIIGLITVPIIVSNIERSRVSTYRTNTQTLMEASKQYVSKTMDNNDFPESGIDIRDLDIKKDNFKSGIIKRCNEKDVKEGNCTSDEIGEIIAVNVYNGRYCAKGTKQGIEVAKVESEKDCNTIDSTAPELTLKVIRRTNNSILVAAYGYDSQSEITKYTFKIGNEEEKEIETSSRVAKYEFTGLKANQEYTITATVENENTGNENENTYRNEKSIKVTTLATNIPTFKISGSGYSNSKEVTIIYPEIEGGENYYDITYDSGKTWTTTKVNENTTKVLFTKNGKIRAYTKYNGGEVENTLNIIGIDEGGPAFELEVTDADSWAQSKVVKIYHKDSNGKKIAGAIDVGAGLADKPYSFDGGKTWTSKETKSYQVNGTITVIARDKMGNKTFKTITITKIDREKPKCTVTYYSPQGYTSTSWTNKQVTLLGTCSDNGECVSPGKTLTTSNEQNQMLSPGEVCDKAGNCTECPKASVKIDTTKPTCGSPTGGKINWTTNRDVTVGVVCVDNGTYKSGCSQSVYYSTISGHGRTGSSTITIKDNAGNVNTCTNTYNKYIDIVAPTCGNNWSGESTTWAKSRTITLSGSTDDLSGIASTSKKTINSETSPNQTIKKAKVSITIKDNAGNEKICEKDNANIYVDNEKPACGNWSGESTSWTKNNRTIKVGCTDSGSGCTASTYTVKTYKSGTTKKDNLSYTIKDNVGNSNTCTKNNANIYVDKDDPSVPTAMLYKWSDNNTQPTSSSGLESYTNDTWSKKKVYSEPSASTDTGSGVDHYEYTTTGTTSNATNKKASYRTIEANGVSYIKWRAVDKAGNASAYSDRKTVKIDKTAPTGSVSGGTDTTAIDGTPSKKTSDTVTVNCSDTGGSGIKTAQASVSLENKTGKPVTVYTCEDNAGNTTDVKTNVCKYEANAAACNGYDSYDCNPRECNCTTKTVLVDKKKVSGSAASMISCASGYVPECEQLFGNVTCYCKKYSTSRSCSTCYDTCYTPKSCCHF